MARYNNLERLVRTGLLYFGTGQGIGSAAAFSIPGVVVSLAGASQTLATSTSVYRGFSSRAQFFDLLTLPSRKGIFNDTVEVSAMLPNRKEFSPQFSPHGITLVPKSILLSASAHAAQTARLEAAKAQLSGLRDRTAVSASQADSIPCEDEHTLHAAGGDKTKVWRKQKMKKHKIKKRRKLNRFKND